MVVLFLFVTKDMFFVCVVSCWFFLSSKMDCVCNFVIQKIPFFGILIGRKCCVRR